MLNEIYETKTLTGKSNNAKVRVKKLILDFHG
jgi:hypothetical protein